ncbi:MAG: metallophosphoesterase [Candidatus Latescibacteria bacterium]|nr:metallophosphoesterase [Candidatus Latescibacterota bacterium]
MFRLKLYYFLMLSVFLFSCVNDEKYTPVNIQPVSISFAAFGNSGLVTDDGKIFRDLAEELKKFDVDFAVDLGNRLPQDVPSSGVDGLLNMVNTDMETVSIPVYPVAGNQDIFDYASEVAYGSHFGPQWYSYERQGIYFIVLSTTDQSYRSGFGETPVLGEEQYGWLWDTLEDRLEGETVVVFMNSPVWDKAPGLWSNRFLPVFKTGDVDLIITCSDDGLFDWGTIDGIRAVSTGCTGPVHQKGIGLFPHFLLVTIDGEGSSFRVLSDDGSVKNGIDIDRNKRTVVQDIVDTITPPVLDTNMSWDISESVDLVLNNPLYETISGSLNFTTFKNTSWIVDPIAMQFSLAPGDTKTFHINFRGRNPDLSPVPVYNLALKIGDTPITENSGMILRKIPKQRTDERIPISARVPAIIPYSFDNKSLRVPIEVKDPDTCGRLIIYSEHDTEIPVCIHCSPLRDFKMGINEFSWNGADLEGKRVQTDSLSYYICVYNKTAPPTWVATGPPSPGGIFEIEKSAAGLIGRTHTDDSLIYYHLAGSVDTPRHDLLYSFGDILDGLPLIGFAFDTEERIFLTTRKGIVCAFLSGGVIRPDISFGDRGYVRFTEYRGRNIGHPVVHYGNIFFGIGAGGGKTPALISINKDTGEFDKEMPLGDYFRDSDLPPTVTASDNGLYVAHPDADTVLLLNFDGELIWVNEPGDTASEKDTDGRSFTYGIGVDIFGFSYVNTPGYSARCSVLGPDGTSLFRVILVILPGLRVSSVVPVIDGKSTDGLYFVTRGADIPYVFHVPYTIKAGKIINDTVMLNR